MTNTYQVMVINSEVPFKLGSIAFVHTQIAFVKNGEIISLFEGNPVDRATGVYNDASAKAGDSTLRVTAHTGHSINSHLQPEKILARSIAFETSNEADFLRMMSKMANSATFINSQNLDYSGIGLTTQNCNSVAYTLLNAAGLKFPEETRKMNMPGNGKILLPNDWVSPSDGLEGENFLRHLQNTLAQLSEAEVGEQTRRDPNPYVGEYLNLGEGGKIRFSEFDPKKVLPIITRPLYATEKPPAVLGSIILSTPPLAELNKSDQIKAFIGQITAFYINTLDEGNNVSPDQALNIINTSPAQAAEALKEALRTGKLPETLKANTKEAQDLKIVIELYVRALENEGRKSSIGPTIDDTNPKSGTLTLSQVLNTSTPIIVQGSLIHVASALQNSGQSIEIKKTTENGIGPSTSPQQILASMAILPHQQKLGDAAIQQNINLA